MKNLRHLAAPVLMLLTAACSNMNAPAIDEVQQPEMRMELNHLKWQSPATAERFSAVAITADGEVALPRTPTTVLADGDSVPLETYQVSFTINRENPKTVRVYYDDALGYSDPYVEFSVGENSPKKWPDGSWIGESENVQITLTIDPVDLEVHLEPSGLEFRTSSPANLKMWYVHADPDYNGDGVVDAVDAAIEQNQFDMWVQQAATDPWYDLNASQDLSDKWLKANLQHFSGYAVSW